MRKKRHELMAEYILPRLEAGGQKFILDGNDIDGVGRVNFLKSDNKRIFLIDRDYSENEYQRLIGLASGRIPYKERKYSYENASIFFKDGKTYFRSAAFGDKSGLKGVKYKQQRSLSLKDYTDDEVRRMILLSQAELQELKRDNNIWYFQPKSERLEEEIIKYRFTPARYNYSYKHYGDGFIPENKNSKRVYINKLVEQLSDSIKLEYGQLRNSDLPPEYRQDTLF
jgi:hypothetical protein